jgi:MATE family multidrug resistance protein
MGLAWVMSVASLYVIFRTVIPTLFTTNTEVIELASAMLVVIAMFQMSDCLQALSISILRGLQDVKIIIPIVFLAYVVITLPAGWLFAFEWGMGPVGLIVALTLGLSTVALCTALRANHTIKQLEKEAEN